ncbi:RBP1A protein, partial [Mionectes macconnelli]|nr:RBP1A protein [Mionectes macconnelli]
MTECFPPPISSPSEYHWGEHRGDLACIPSSEEISPTKFPGPYCTDKPLAPH